MPNAEMNILRSILATRDQIIQMLMHRVGDWIRVRLAPVLN